MWTPVTSQGEENQPFIHISILSDPYEVMGHLYHGGFKEFTESHVRLSDTLGITFSLHTTDLLLGKLAI